MSETEPGVLDPRKIKRRSINLATGEAVKTRLLDGRSLPLVMEPALSALNPVSWAENNLQCIETLLLKYGALLFRGFSINSAEQFAAFVNAISGEPLKYEERSAPRSEIQSGIYTSTDYPADQSIFPHNEHSYAMTVPLRLYFCSLVPALTGGATPIADCRRLMARLNPRLIEKFQRLGWMYVRNFGDGFGLSWQTAFQTTNKKVVEDYCRRADISFEWKSGDRLRTRQIRPAISVHPRTQEPVWFNHATFFHVSTLAPATRDVLLKEFSETDLPNNTYYGDGSPIGPGELEELRRAYIDETVRFPWERGDVLLIDNMLTAHSREAFTGSRRVLVAMAEPVTRDANDAQRFCDVSARELRV